MHGTLPATPQRRPASGSRLPLLLRLAFRELRGGLHGFGIFLACIALGVAAIASVSSLSRSLTEGITREGRRILGGDMAFSLLQREAAAARTRLPGNQGTGRRRRHHARHGGGRREGLGPRGDEGGRWGLSHRRRPRDRSAGRPRRSLRRAQRRLRRGGGPGASRAARPEGRRPGHGRRAPTWSCGRASVSEPDKIADGIGFGPRLLLSQEALQATGLVQPGSLVRWTYRLTLPPSLSTDGGADPDRGGGEPPPARGRLERPHARSMPIRALPATSSASPSS